MSNTTSSQSSVDLFRRLNWQNGIPLEIRLADGEPGAGSGCDRYYTIASPHTCLGLLIPEIRENLIELALDDEQLSTVNEANWWFEDDGGALSPQPDQQTGRPSPATFAPTGPCRWHWPLELIAMQHLTASPGHPAGQDSIASTSKTSPYTPLRLLLHLSNPPSDKLLTQNTVEATKSQFLNSLKEADFVRWRNTKRVTGLREVDLEAGWDGILNDDYDAYTRISSRVNPLPLRPTSPAAVPAARDGGSESSGTSKSESSYTVRALPIKVYLPDNAPMIQDVFPPLSSTGHPLTLLDLVRSHLPLLFPSFAAGQDPYALAFPLAQGIEIPPEAELAWLSSCMSGADGWLRLAIRLRAGA